MCVSVYVRVCNYKHYLESSYYGNFIAVSIKLWIPVLVPNAYKKLKSYYDYTMQNYIQRFSGSALLLFWALWCLCHWYVGISTVHQKSVESLFPEKKKTVLSMVTYQSLTASATLLAFGSPSSTHGSYILSYRIQRKIPEILKGIRSLQTFVFFNMLQL